jgi:hypothetical protein
VSICTRSAWTAAEPNSPAAAATLGALSASALISSAIESTHWRRAAAYRLAKSGLVSIHPRIVRLGG